MSAMDTAIRVIRWAYGTSPQPSPWKGEGARESMPPPQGDIMGIDGLTRPTTEARECLGNLAALTAARLRMGPGAGEAAESVDAGLLVLAVAIGVSAHPKLVKALRGAIPDPLHSPWIDWVTRHGLVSPALRYTSQDVADELRSVSPLTCLLDRPGPGDEPMAWKTLEKAMANPKHRAAITVLLAIPDADPAVRGWRSRMLDRLRTGDDRARAFVLDVYETALVSYRDPIATQIREARTALFGGSAGLEASEIAGALTVAEWWGPLWRLCREDIDSLRQRYYLGYDYLDGIKLYQRSRNLTGDYHVA
ncbi:MAG: hypothetical protein ACLQVD_17510 [Capsulimonadaceae bacterium]